MKVVQHTLTLMIIMTVGLSCNKSEETVKYEGEAIISSEIIEESVNMYIVYGFSFEKGENIPYYLTSNSPPDIIVTKLENLQGDSITGAILNSPNNYEAFYLDLEASSYSDARAWFENYNEVTATNFVPMADSVKLFQVWTMQTTAGKFAKLLIKKIDIIPGTPMNYVEVTVDYEYQPDGTRIFRTNRSGS
jgi:hypothetical protein